MGFGLGISLIVLVRCQVFVCPKLLFGLFAYCFVVMTCGACWVCLSCYDCALFWMFVGRLGWVGLRLCCFLILFVASL